MKNLSRHPQNRYRSAKQFRKHAQKTKGANVVRPPQRGGYRF